MTNANTFDEAASFLYVLGYSERLKILWHLKSRELCVTELCKLSGLSQSAMSQHLSKLRALKIVNCRRDAQFMYYSASHKVCYEIFSLLERLDFLKFNVLIDPDFKI